MRTLDPFCSRAFISGMHRSGTTWLGKALSYSPACAVLHEPFNYQFGVEGVSRWYMRCPDDTETINSLVENVLSGDAYYQRKRPNDSVFKAMARHLTGGPDNLKYRLLFTRDQQKLLIKDPFCAQFGLHLVRNFNFRGIYLVRHPGAIFHSLNRMSWKFPEELINDTLERNALIVEPNQEYSQAFLTGLIWADIYGNVLSDIKKSNGHLIMLRHEELCLEPLLTVRKALNHLGLEWTSNTEKFLNQSTSGTIVNPNKNVLHSMERDSKSIIDAWREEVSDEEKREIAIGGNSVLELVYGD